MERSKKGQCDLANLRVFTMPFTRCGGKEQSSMESLNKFFHVLLLVCTLLLSGCFGGGAAVEPVTPPPVIRPLPDCPAPHGPPPPAQLPPGGMLVWLGPPPSAEHQPIWVSGHELQRLMVIQQASGNYPALMMQYERAAAQVRYWTEKPDGSNKANQLAHWTRERDRLKLELEQAALALGMRYEEPGAIDFPLNQNRPTQKK